MKKIFIAIASILVILASVLLFTKTNKPELYNPENTEDYIFLSSEEVEDNDKKDTDFDTKITVNKAVWYNWSGGQAGVGGTNYQIYITTQQENVVFEKIIIDNNELSISSVEKEEDTYIVYIVESRSISRDDFLKSGGTTLPNTRKENPTRTALKGTINGEPFNLNILNFEKIENKNLIP